MIYLARNSGSLILMCFLCFTFTQGFSQKTGGVYLPQINEQTPDWFLTLYDEPKVASWNAFSLDSAFLEYQNNLHPSGHIEESSLNSYELYYIRWRRSVEPFIQANGSIFFKEESSDVYHHSSAKMTDIWSLVGPTETYFLEADDPDQAAAPWQVNIYAIAVAKTNPDILFATAETGGIFHTTDKGMNWSLSLDRATTYESVAIAPSDENHIIAGGYASLARSTDGGDTWTTSTFAVGSIHSLAYHPENPNIIMLGATDGLYRSEDGGATWESAGGLTGEIYDVHFHVSDPDIFFAIRRSASVINFIRSEDAGVTFTSGFEGVDPVNTNGARMTLTANNPDRIYIVALGTAPSITSPHIYRSDDGGASWMLMCTGVSSGLTGDDSFPLGMSNGQGYYDLDIIANPQDADDVIVASTTAYKSTNGGNSFSRIGGYGGEFPIHPDIQDMIALDGDTWITTDGGINYSNDFYTSISNYESRTNGIFGTDFWGFSQGWNEDFVAGGRYHNGNTAMSDQYPPGQALRLGGGEAGTGYAMVGRQAHFAFSDISSHQLPLTFDGAKKYFPFNQFPNEDGYGFDASEVEFAPYCFGNIYIGYENALWMSDNLGGSFFTLYDFGQRVKKFDISRANPEVIYLATQSKFYYTDNGGSSWEERSLPIGVSKYRMEVAASATSPETVWITSPNNGIGNRVFRSDDAGLTWINMTTPLIDNQGYACLVNQKGSENGIYVLGNNGTAFYTDDSMADWEDISAGLPLGNSPLRSYAFYRDSKIRVAGNRGVWEADLMETLPPIAQPTVDKLISTCAEDTFKFEDFSVMDHTGATWLWEFSPEPLFVSDYSARNPSVVFGATGNYDYTLTVSNDWGSDTKTETGRITIEGNECGVDTLPGAAIVLGGNSDPGNISIEPMDLNTNTMTISMWFKPDGIQSDYSSLFMLEGEEAAGFNFRPGENRLGYHWPGGAWWWESGLNVPEGRWSHLAMVVEPDGITIYLNGIASKHFFDATPVDFSQNGVLLGSYKKWGGRYVKGEMDEVAIYNRAMNQDEIRNLMHLTRNNPHPGNKPEFDSSLIGYYQFNETVSYFYNKAGNNIALPEGSAVRTNSTAPVAGGTFSTVFVDGAGTITFTEPEVEITYAEGLTYPEDDVIVSRLHSTPDYSPEDSILPNPGKYFVLRQFGNADAAAPDAIKIIDIDGITESIASNSAYVHLYTRDYFGEGDSWSVADSADMIDEGDASIFFNELVFGNEGQFVMGVDDSAFVGSEPTTIETEITTEENLFPNPSTDGWYHLQLANKQADVSALIRITDMRGAIVHHFVVGKSRINQEQHFHLPQTGSYILIIEYSDGTYSKIPLVRS